MSPRRGKQVCGLGMLTTQVEEPSPPRVASAQVHWLDPAAEKGISVDDEQDGIAVSVQQVFGRSLGVLDLNANLKIDTFGEAALDLAG